MRLGVPRYPFLNPTHPVLAGIEVPVRHRRFIGKLLGAPYIKARSRAVALAIERRKHAAKVAAKKAMAAIVTE